MKFSLPSNVEFIIDRLESAGFTADIVGGSVRDLLLGKSPDDYDITTSATPDMIKQVFSDFHTVDTGIKHGTVSLILDKAQYEITTYRVDGEYKDSRHPESVSFTTKIEDDLSRRDFTVNAIAYNPRRGITDPFGGREDLERKIIRAVGEAELRFSEDALRILRGIRFSAVLGFEIEKKTSSALREKMHLISGISAERIYVELKKLISGKYAYSVIEEYSDILSFVIPEIQNIRLPDGERFVNSDYISRILSIFYLSSKEPGRAFAAFCRDLHTDSALRNDGYAILSSVGRYKLTDVVSLTHLLHDLGEDRARKLIDLEILLGREDNCSLTYLEALISSKVCYRIADLKVGGDDLIALGVRGKKIGQTMEYLLNCVIEKQVANDRDTLISLAKKIL